VLSGPLAGLFFGVSPVQAEGLFDKMLDRAIDSAERKTQNRINQRIDQTIDKGLNKTEETIHCVATDQECFKRAKEEGKQVSVISAPSSFDSVKCVVTDTSCLKQAETQGKKVEIVDEADLDTLRCSVSDGDCLKRAKSLGKRSKSLIDRHRQQSEEARCITAPPFVSLWNGCQPLAPRRLSQSHPVTRQDSFLAC